MDVSELILLGAVVALVVYALVSGGVPRLQESGRVTWDLLASSWHRMLVGFALAGLLSVLIPSEVIARHLGEGSGLSGLLLATVAGALTPGGPFMQFPIVASLYRSGAAAGPLAAYLTAWGLIPMNRLLVWEIPFLGPQFAWTRMAASLIVPVLLGLLVPVVLKLTQR